MEQLWSFDALHLFSVFWGFMDGPFLRRRVFFFTFYYLRDRWLFHADLDNSTSLKL